MTRVNNEDPQIEIAYLLSANEQAAEYGLALLNEKNQLKLEYELLKTEFKQLKNRLKIFQINKNVEILENENNEERLLNEKQIQEEYLINKIKQYKQELYLLKQNNEQLEIENKKIHFHSQELIKQIQELNKIKLKLKYDLKESQNHEQKLLDINIELEEDNVLLQQQIDRLTKNLLNYDELKIENKQLQSNIDVLHRMINEFQSLKIITDSQLVELHNHLRDERKQKHIYKQQLDDQLQKESFHHLNSLRMTLDDEDTIHISSSIDYKNILENDQPSTENLFNEIHNEQINKLEFECLRLSQIKSSLDNQLLIINKNTKILAEKILPIKNKIDSEDTNDLLIILIEQIDQFNLLNNPNDILMNISDELDHLHSHIYTSYDIQIKKRQFIDSNNQITTEQLFDILHEQIKQLKQLFDQVLLSNTKQINDDQSNDTNQIHKLRLLLTTKSEQILTLRKLLKDNKQTAEIVLAKLKSKYENEKILLIDTISKLRTELKLFKENTANHTMFIARCDESMTQLTKIQRQIQVCEEEKKTLNLLLHMAIEQKLILTQKIKDLEMNNSMPSVRRERFIPPRMIQRFTTNQNQ